VLAYMLDENEFLSPMAFALSRATREHPLCLRWCQEFKVQYLPASRIPGCSGAIPMAGAGVDAG